MIKILNQKNIAEINNMEKEGTYCSPFFGENNLPNSGGSYDDSELLKRIDDLESELAESQKTVADYVKKTEDQAKTIDELNADLDVLVGGSDE